MVRKYGPDPIIWTDIQTDRKADKSDYNSLQSPNGKDNIPQILQYGQTDISDYNSLQSPTFRG